MARKSKNQEDRIYQGRMLMESGLARDVFLRKGRLHWVTNDKIRFRIIDGSCTTHDIHDMKRQGMDFPRLVLNSIKQCRGNSNQMLQVMTHYGDVYWSFTNRRHERARLRETSKFYIDPYGEKYRKTDGTSVKNEKIRLNLSSVKELPKNQEEVDHEHHDD